MHQLLRTTTSIVTCLSLIMPQLAVAQASPELKQIILQQKKQQQQKPQPAAKREEKPRPQPPKPRAAAPSDARQQAKPQIKPPVQTRREQPAARKSAPQAEAQVPRKPQPQAQRQPARQNRAPEAQRPTPEPRKPPQRDAEQRRDSPPIAQRPRTAQPDRDVRPTGQGKAPTPDAQELRRALERNRPDAQAQSPSRRAGDNPRPAAGQDRPQAGADGQISTQELRRRLEQGGGGTRIAPPEARQPENEVTRRAAQGTPAPAVAALAAAAGGQVSERKITQQNARRSSDDFRTRIEDGDEARDRLQDQRERELDQRERALRQDQQRTDRELDRREEALDRADARYRHAPRYHDNRRSYADDDDDGDTLKTVGALLLAGAAGMAVGKLLDGNRQVALNTGDRVVMTMPDGSQQIVRDDNALLYQPGSDVRTETFADGSTRTTVLRADGSRVVTIRDANANILRRTLIRADGSQVPLINDTAVRPVQVSTLPRPQQVEYYNRPLQEDELRAALLRESATDRRFTLGQIRDIPEVRALVAPVNVPQVTFDSGSAALSSDQAEHLATLGQVIRDAITQNPNEMFLIEGYTDAVGSPASNLALSDRRAESLALALTEYFQVPPENMVVQGYGEQFLLVPSEESERENRRVSVRRITDLLEQGSS